MEKLLEEFFGASEFLRLDKEGAEKMVQLLSRWFCPIDGKTVEPVPSEFVAQLPPVALRTFCHYKAIYGIVTLELISYLRELIGDDKAIEIGSGVGTLGKALGIKCTDNYCQTFADVKASYLAMQQPVINYGSHVERMDANKAVRKYRPKVVIGSWITHKYNPLRHEMGGNMYGPNEHQFFKMGVERYIMLGNEKIHGKKPLYNDPDYHTQRIATPYYFSRAKYPLDNYIYITTKK